MRDSNTMSGKTFRQWQYVFEKCHESTMEIFWNENAAVCEYAQEIISIFLITTVA